MIKKPIVRTPKSGVKPLPKSAPIVASTPSDTGSEDSDDSDDEEGDDDDDEDDDEEVQRPAPKKIKTTSAAVREKKQSK